MRVASGCSAKARRRIALATLEVGLKIAGVYKNVDVLNAQLQISG